MSEWIFCTAIPVVGPIIGIAEILGGLFGHHGPSFHPNGPPFGRSGAGQDSGPLQGETLGLPNSVRLRPPSLLQTVGVLPVSGPSDFLACAPSVGEDFADQLEKNQHSCGDFICDDNGKIVGVLPAIARGIQPTNIEFDVLTGGFYLSRINSNPFLRVGPGPLLSTSLCKASKTGVRWAFSQLLEILEGKLFQLFSSLRKRTAIRQARCRAG